MNNREAYNSTFRRSLSLMLLDLIRMQCASGEECTNRTLLVAVQERTQVQDKNLRHRVRVAVRDMELSGFIERTKKQPADPERLPYKVITLKLPPTS